MKKYVLVEFPLSQHFDSNDDDCHICLDVDGAIFVPEEKYNDVMDYNQNQGLSDNLSTI